MALKIELQKALALCPGGRESSHASRRRKWQNLADQPSQKMRLKPGSTLRKEPGRQVSWELIKARSHETREVRGSVCY